MTNPDPKIGGWAVKERLLSTQMNSVRTGLLQSLDGVGGGTYSPTAVLEIGGANGLRIAGTGSGARLRYSSRNIIRTLPKSAAYANSADWTFDHDPAFQYWSAVGANDFLYFDLNGIPNGATINEITVNASENAATAIEFKAMEIAADDNTISDIFAYYVDGAVSASFHAITKTAIAHAINKRDNRYVLIVKSGQASDRVASVQVDVTLTDQSEWDP
jgi:hypothetical protein